MRKWQKRQPIYHTFSKNLTLFGQKQLDLEGNNEETA
jgi:hypothetical protein